MNTSLITCPKCKSEIPLTDAMAHQVREQMEKEYAVKQSELLDAIAAREQAVLARSRAVEEAQRFAAQATIRDTAWHRFLDSSFPTDRRRRVALRARARPFPQPTL